MVERLLHLARVQYVVGRQKLPVVPAAAAKCHIFSWREQSITRADSSGMKSNARAPKTNGGRAAAGSAQCDHVTHELESKVAVL